MTTDVITEPDTKTATAGPVSSDEPAFTRPPRRRPRDPEHARVVGARRRLLGMLIALALGAAILGYLKLAAWWVIIPPTILLICYLALLREASRADAERRWAAASRTQDTRPAAPPAPPVKAPATAPVTAAAPSAQPPAPVRTPSATTVRVATLAPAPPPVPDAEIIDITARVSDDLYDQVADAKLRAVGD